MRHLWWMWRKPLLAALALGVAGVLISLAGCGQYGVAALAPTNTSPPTQAGGPVRIATDHSIYRPNEPIHVSVTNTLSQSIYALDTRASCSILGLEWQTNGAWQPAQAANCPLGRVALAVKIKPGATYHATITAGYPGLRADAFVPGSYRLALTYAPTKVAPGETGPGTTMYSATITVAGAPLPLTPSAAVQPASGTAAASPAATVVITSVSP